MRLVDLLKQEGLTMSISDSRRVICQDAVRLNGELITDILAKIDVKPGDVLECGRKRVEIKEPIIIDTKEKLYEHFGNPLTKEQVARLTEALLEDQETGIVRIDPETGECERI